MTKKSTKTISLCLNFNNENQYNFAIKLPRRRYKEDLWYLTAGNSDGEGIALALDKPLIRNLVQAGVFEEGHSIIYVPPKKRRMAAKHAEVSSVKEVEPPAEISVPAACGALPDTNVIHVEFSPKAK